ncbi:hypothetical protein [Streptosporangium sp. CA-115845]|uniref:hypothetical protein n=1 Tax=Streptosporangium sp. CA-115845 TaxID=3240071 RepID=UPI003D939EF5
MTDGRAATPRPRRKAWTAPASGPAALVLMSATVVGCAGEQGEDTGPYRMLPGHAGSDGLTYEEC